MTEPNSTRGRGPRRSLRARRRRRGSGRRRPRCSPAATSIGHRGSARIAGVAGSGLDGDHDRSSAAARRASRSGAGPRRRRRRAPAPRSVATTKRPNIVVILTDDQRFDTLWAMPQVQSLLVDHGITFKNSFVTNSFCCPSRATILTGNFSHTTGIYGNVPPHGGAPDFHEYGDDKSTIATWLQGAGYDTGLFGKYLNDYHGPFIPPGWSRWDAFNYGFRYYGFQAFTNARAVRRPARLRRQLRQEPVLDDGLRRGGGPVHPRRAGHEAALRLLRAVRAARARRARDAVRQPLPEPAAVAAAELRQGEREPPAYLRARKPLRQAPDQAARAVPPPPVRDAALGRRRGGVDRRRAARHRPAVEHDDRVRLRQRPCLGRAPAARGREADPLRRGHPGAVRRALRPDDDDAAHGFAHGREHRLGADVRRPRGREPPKVEGRSFLPIVQGAPLSPPWRTSFLLENWDGSPKTLAPTYCGIRSTRYLYVRYGTGEEELYDQLHDPFDLHNVADSPAYAGVLAAHRAEMLRECQAAAARLQAAVTAREAVRRRRLAAQLLAGRPARSAAAVAARLLAIQSQNLRAGRLAVRARTSGLTAAGVNAELEAARVVITWLCRGTLHMVCREDYPWLLGLSAPTQRHEQPAPPAPVRIQPRPGPQGGRPDRAHAGRGGAAAALGDRRAPGGGRVCAGRPGARAPAVPAVARRPHHPRAVPRRRAGVRAHARLAGRGACGRSRPDERPRALAELARRYLAGHGPAVGGRPGAVGRAAAARCGGGARGALRRAARGGGGLVDLAPPRPAPRTLPPRLLPAFDAYLLGWKDRTYAVPPERVAEIRLGGIIRPVALVDGVAAGTWAARGGGGGVAVEID